MKKTIEDLLHERIQHVYAQFLADNNIKYGDVTPDMALEFERIEGELAQAIDKWINQSKSAEQMSGGDNA